MTIARCAAAILLAAGCQLAVAQDTAAAKPVHQHELKQGQPTIEDEGKNVAIKELEAFHESLHPLVHDLMPNKDLAGVRSRLADLLKSARLAAGAALPRELASKKDEYRRLGAQLVRQITRLQSTKNDAKFEKLFDSMHMTFEEMISLTAGH